MSKFVAFCSDNAAQIDVSEALQTLEKECPKLLSDGETIALAFRDRGGKGRDDSFFTDRRILIRDKKLLTGTKTKYISIPYKSIKCWTIETAGSMDSDCELSVVATGAGKVKFDFMTKVDIFAVKRFLSEKILRGSRIGQDAASGAVATDGEEDVGKGKTKGSGFFDWIGGNQSQIDAGVMEKMLKDDLNILLPDETIELAFKCGRDSFVLSSHRLIRIDTKGITGKRVEYQSILWTSIRAYSMEMAGSFDRDNEMILYTNIGEYTRINIDFRKGKSDMYAVQKFFADKILGMDTADPSAHAPDSSGTLAGSFGNVFSWFGDDNRTIDAAEMDRQYHSDPPILQESEKVEMAFKGRRDLILLTSKRLLEIDMKGWSGKKVEFFSLPWKNVQAFGVSSAGSFLDKDSEMMVWTDINDVFFPPDDGEEGGPPPPIPRKTFLEIDFQKDKVDLMALKRYLAERCLHLDGGGVRPGDVPVPLDTIQASPPGAVDNFLSWLGNDARVIDPKEMDDQLHKTNPILQDDEHVAQAYKAGRDTLIFTTKRVFVMDTKGFSGKRIAYISVPYTSIHAFSVESAGSWDRDAEVKLYPKIYWYGGEPGSVIEQDLRKGKADAVAMHTLLSAQILGSQDGSSGLLGGATSNGGAGTFEGFLKIGDDAAEIDAVQVTEKLQSNPPILQKDETVDVAYKIGRDMCLFTTKRILFIDRQGFTGKKVEYKSYPLRYCTGFKVQSGTALGLVSSKVTVYTDAPGLPKLKQDLKKSKSDIFAVNEMLSNKILKE